MKTCLRKILLWNHLYLFDQFSWFVDFSRDLCDVTLWFLNVTNKFQVSCLVQGVNSFIKDNTTPTPPPPHPLPCNEIHRILLSRKYHLAYFKKTNWALNKTVYPKTGLITCIMDLLFYLDWIALKITMIIYIFINLNGKPLVFIFPDIWICTFVKEFLSTIKTNDNFLVNSSIKVFFWVFISLGR